MQKLTPLFLGLNIEYFSVLSYADCKGVRTDIMSREDFEPRSVIIYLLPYYTGECQNISRYSASLDYHLAIREINKSIENHLTERFPNAKMKGYGDHSPINECHAALCAGLGIAGDNGLLINEKYGSYIFIGDIITDIPPETLCAKPPLPIRRCEGCGLCREACPTGILSGNGADCLSMITQKKGELSEQEQSLMRKYNTAWGCDECQSACPHNLNPEKTPVEFFYRERIDRLDRKTLDAMDKASFNMRAFAWRGRKTVERNLDILEKKTDGM